jgi:hypothetical protein
MSIPRFNFSKKLEKEEPIVFNPDNIFLVSGHGIEYTNEDRHPLGENQHALIPGGCGLKIQTITEDVYKQFFYFKENLEVFHNRSKNENISSKLGIQYKFLEENLEGVNSPKEESQLFKYYFPGAANPLRATIPAMVISPLLVEKSTLNTNKILRIELSGILRKTHPVLFPPGPYMYDTEYVRFIKYEDADLERKLSESPITETIKAALEGSLLNLNDILALMGKTEEEVSVDEIINYTIYLPYIFNYISSKVNGPYLLIVLTCRDSAKPAMPKTPSRRSDVLGERRKIIENARKLRRQSSVGMRPPPPLFNSGSLFGLTGGRQTQRRRRVARRRRTRRRVVRRR